MNNEKQLFLSQRFLPLRLDASQAGWLMGFTKADIAILIANKLLAPMGNPSQNATKYFAAAQIEKLRDNIPWLNKANVTLNEHWREKNARKKGAKTQ